MKKICFVCEGNICRSPIAEYLMKDLLRKEGMDKDYEVFSRGLTNETRGEDIHPLSKEQLDKHHIPYGPHKAQKICFQDYADSDYVIVMEQYNILLLRRLFLLKSQDAKVRKLLSFTGSSKDIDDPYYTRNFSVAYADIEKGCKAFLEYLKKSYQEEAK